MAKSSPKTKAKDKPEVERQVEAEMKHKPLAVETKPKAEPDPKEKPKRAEIKEEPKPKFQLPAAMRRARLLLVLVGVTVIVSVIWGLSSRESPVDLPTESSRDLAEKALAAGRESEAIRRFQQIVDEDPTQYRVVEQIGNENLKAERWSSAAAFLKMAADARSRIGADDHTLYYNVGAALYNSREDNPRAVREAISFYERALEVQPDDPQTIYNIVLANAEVKDWREAVRWGEKYVKINSSDQKGWELLSRSYTEIGEKDQAQAFRHGGIGVDDAGNIVNALDDILGHHIPGRSFATYDDSAGREIVPVTSPDTIVKMHRVQHIQ